MSYDRRRFLRLSGLAAAGVLAGCAGGGDGGGGGGGGGNGGGGTTAGGGNGGGTATGGGAATGGGTATATATAGGTTTGGGAATVSPATTAGGATTAGTGTAGAGAGTTTAGTGSTVGGSQAIGSWLSNVGNYDGTVKDETGQSAVDVAVGAEGNGGNFAFEPAAVRISRGTLVTWQWTGEGAHNVVARNGSFRSGPPQQGSDIEYTRTFDSPGTVLYFCGPHRSLGMKGAVIVEG